MATYMMDDGTVVDTAKATASWNEDTEDGWPFEQLYRSAKDRYYKVWASSSGSSFLPRPRYITPFEATAWLITNGKALPEDLEPLRDEVTE